MNGEECGSVAEQLGLCGCMEGGEVMRWVGRALQLIAARTAADWDNKAIQLAIDKHFLHNEDDEASYENPVYWLLWAALDRADLIEHGGNVMGSWLTDKGKDFAEALFNPPAGWDPEEPLSWDNQENGAMVQYVGLSDLMSAEHGRE